MVSYRQILNELLPQVMVYSIHLILCQKVAQLLLKLCKGLAVFAEGLLHYHTRPA